MATLPKNSDIDKENLKVVAPLSKKDKAASEDTPVKKTVLGESSQQKKVAVEPSSPEDSKLLEKKRAMKYGNAESFSFSLAQC